MTLRLVSFGPPQLTSDGGDVPPELAWRKHFGLLVYLARSPHGTRRRDHLVGLLWPDKDEAKARHSLNEACRAIRRGAGEHALSTGADAITLDPAALAADWTEAEAALAANDAPKLAALWRGEFLEGFGIPDATGFEDWLGAERMLWRAKFRDALSAAAAHRAAQGDTAGAFEFATRVLAVDGDDAAALALVERTESAAGARSRAGMHAAGAAAARAVPAAPLVGRSRELDALAAWLPRPGSRAATVLICGGPGHGKSRLLRETASRAQLGGACLAAAACVESDGDAPGSVLAALLRGMAGAPGLGGAPPDALATLAALEPALARRFPGAAPNGNAPALSGATLGRALGAALVAVADESPAALVVDDAHLADPLTLAALTAALPVAAAAPVLLLLAALPDAMPESMLAMRSRIGHDLAGAEIAAGALDEGAVAALVEAMLPAWSDEERARLVRRLKREASGVPLYIIEILRALAAAGPGSGIWPLAGETASQPLPFEVPGAVVAALTLRVRQLGPDARATLLAAAALGDSVNEPLLGTVRERDAATLARELGELERAGFLAYDGARYRFAAALVRSVLVAEMLAGGERRALHELAARALVPGETADATAVLAWAEHLYGAGRWQEAAAAASRAAALGTTAGQERLALRAQRLAGKAAERVRTA